MVGKGRQTTPLPQVPKFLFFASPRPLRQSAPADQITWPSPQIVFGRFPTWPNSTNGEELTWRDPRGESLNVVTGGVACHNLLECEKSNSLTRSSLRCLCNSVRSQPSPPSSATHPAHFAKQQGQVWKPRQLRSYKQTISKEWRLGGSYPFDGSTIASPGRIHPSLPSKDTCNPVPLGSFKDVYVAFNKCNYWNVFVYYSHRWLLNDFTVLTVF